jgi:hypothetical protein
VVLSITPSGRALLRSSPDIAQLRLINALRDLSSRDRRSLVRTLDHIVHEMGADAAPALFFEEGAARGRKRKQKTVSRRKQGTGSRKRETGTRSRE